MRSQVSGALYPSSDGALISGEFDRYLVRPASPLVQVVSRELRITCFGDLLGGTALLVATWLGVAAPAIGVTLFLIALRIWHRQSRHSQSAGS